MLAVLILLPAISYFSLKNHAVQTWVLEKVASKAAKNLDTEFSIGSVAFIFFNQLTLEEVLIKDQQLDTLFYFPRISAKLNKLSTKERVLDLQHIRLHDPRVRFVADSSGKLNLDFIARQLARKDTTKKRMKIRIRNIRMKGADFSLTGKNPRPDGFGMNYSDLRLSEIQLQMKELKVHGDTIRFDLKGLGCISHYGFIMRDLSASAHIDSKGMRFDEVHYETFESFLEAPKIWLLYDSYEDLGRALENVRMDIRIDTSNLNTRDVGMLAGVPPPIIENFSLSGDFSGIISELKGREVLITFRAQTLLKTDFDFSGLPDLNQAFLFMEVEKLEAHAADFEVLRFREPDSNSLYIPPWLYDLGVVEYTGNFTGFFDNFVSYGTFHSDLGIFSTDLSVHPDTANLLHFNGHIDGKGIDAGYFAGSDVLKKMWMSFRIDGYTGTEGQYSAQLEGSIDSLHANGYNYKNIELDGLFTEDSFDGSVKSDEENLQMDFLGRVEYGEELPVFDFSLNLPHADLNVLNLDRTDSISHLNVLLTANFTGNSLDNMNGEIKLLNSRFRRDQKKLQIYDLTARAFRENDTGRLSLESDFADADLWGEYRFTTLLNSLQSALKPVLPSLSSLKPAKENTAGNSFRYAIHLKNTDKLTRFINPGLRIAEDVRLEGIYRPEKQQIAINGSADYLLLDKNRLVDLSLEAALSDSLFYISLRSGDVLAQNMLRLGATELFTVLHGDTVDLQLKWNNTDSLKNEGEILSQARLSREKEGHTKVTIDVLPTEMFVRNKPWTISPGTVVIDTTYALFNNISFRRENHSLLVDGVLSKRPSDTLMLKVERLGLESLNYLGKPGTTTGERPYRFNGTLSGTAFLSDVYNNPLFESDIMVSGFGFNETSYGNLQVTSYWDTLLNALRIFAFNEIGEMRNLSVNGSYIPEEQDLDLTVNLDSLNMEVFGPLLRSFSSEVQGFASGSLMLEGSAGRPVVTGSVFMDQASVKIDFLNTVYSFNDRLIFENNSLRFDSILLRDKRGNTSLLRGSIDHEYFDRLQLNLTFEPDNFRVLNTSPWHNDNFYGTAYASGIVNITGPAEQISIDISATTNANTRFFVPLASESSVTEYSYIQFIETDTLSKTGIDIPEPEEATGGNIAMNFDLQVTPEAEVQLIFDSRLGDVIRARGQGQINLNMEPEGRLEMAGAYDIEEGDYLFTLGNVINKRFEVESGSSMQWNGDPADALIDLNAIYRVKASLYDLIQDEAFRRRIPVECRLNLTNRLSDPVIEFDIQLPTTDEETRSYLQNAINSDEEMSRQFLSLLVVNSFYADPNVASPSTTGASSVNALNTTTSELLSNQLSNWLSQISNDVDVGFTYRPGNEISSQEVELALSTQLLNDRVSISTNVDVTGEQQQTTTPANTSTITGDFIMEIKLTENGKLRFKAFNRANDNILYETAPHTQGIGLFYREEFDEFNLLLKQYWNSLFRKKEEEGRE